MQTDEPGAVVVLGALFGARYPRLVPAATERGLTVLGVDTRTPGKERFDQARRSHPEHPLAGLAELVWIPGDRPEQVLDQVVRWSAGHRIRAVLAFGEDYVEAAAVVVPAQRGQRAAARRRVHPVRQAGLQRHQQHVVLVGQQRRDPVGRDPL
ncbi:hypothetical protein ACFQ0D_36980, partial [Micromonospora zhanjiangensis]